MNEDFNLWEFVNSLPPDDPQVIAFREGMAGVQASIDAIAELFTCPNCGHRR